MSWKKRINNCLVDVEDFYFLPVCKQGKISHCKWERASATNNIPFLVCYLFLLLKVNGLQKLVTFTNIRQILLKRGWRGVEFN